MKSICIYCGSSDKVKNKYLEAASNMGKAVAQRGMTLIYGGGKSGLMGAVANAALELGGEVIGVIPEIFSSPTHAHADLSQIEIVADMHTRKARMAELADGFVALPGGFGTLEEFFEALTWAQIGLHSKPIGLLNTDGYYSHLLKFIQHIKSEKFAYDQHGDLLTYGETPELLLEKLAEYQPPQGLEEWLEG